MSRPVPPSPPRKVSSAPPHRRLLGRRGLLWGAAVIIPVGAIGIWEARPGNAASIKATLYKNPQCSCCESYASYLGDHGFDVKVIPSNDLELINQQHGVPKALDGCHITMTEGYVVIGHIPVDLVQRLLKKKPDIVGISLPGMPSGTPGMDGPKPGPLTVYAFGKSGQSVFATV